MTSRLSQRRTVVVGGGIAGLASAAYLARRGFAVTVLEKSSHLGGRARTQERSGVLYNLGPHALYRGGSAARVLAELGVAVTGGSPPKRGLAIHRGQLHWLPSGPASLLLTRLLSFRAKGEFLRRLRCLLREDPRNMRGRTVAEYCRSEFTSAEARLMIEGLFRLNTYTNAPEYVDLGDALAQLVLGLRHGVLYLDGGWQTVVEGLRQAAERAGATIVTSAAVAQIRSGHKPTIVLENRTQLECDAVILAVPPEAGRRILPVAGMRVWAEAAMPACAACLDVTLTALPRPDRLFALGIDRPWYYSVHTAVARLAPRDRVTVSLAKYLRLDKTGCPADDLHELEGVLDLLQPGWRHYEVKRQYLPRITVISAIPRHDRGGIPGRPGPAVPGTHGIFVAGDWVSAEGWLADAALASARRAAEEVQAYLDRAGEIEYGGAASG